MNSLNDLWTSNALIQAAGLPGQNCPDSTLYIVLSAILEILHCGRSGYSLWLMLSPLRIHAKPASFWINLALV